jgi:hypothetical protein
VISALIEEITMSTLYSSLRRSKRWLLVATLVPATVIAVLATLPKDAAYAAVDRFVMTLLAVATALAGVIGVTVAWRSYRGTAVRAYYHKAPRAMKDTLQFLLQERRAARRYRLPLLFGVVSASALMLLANWPQVALLAPYKPVFVASAIGLVILLFIQPLHARRAIVNAIFLKRYLKQQGEYIGYVPDSKPQPQTQNEPAVTKTGPSTFRAGGFEWHFTDLQKGLIVLGIPGSGKTVTVLNSLLEGCLGCENDAGKIGGIITDPKGTWHDDIEETCARAGRKDDLYILSAARWPDAARTAAAIAYNPLDTDEDGVEVAAQFMTVAKLVGGVRTNDSFFMDGARVFMRHAFTLLREAAAPEPTNLLDLYRLCAEPTDEPIIYESLIQKLYEKYGNNPPHAVEMSAHYMETEWRTLPDRQRAGTRSTLLQPLDDFTTGAISEIIVGKSTISIDEILDDGKLLYLHLPLAERERVARILTGLIKLKLQTAVLRRPRKTRLSFMIADEYQTLFVAGENQGDSDFLERARESSHASLLSVQNLGSLTKKIGNRAEVTSALGLLGTKIFLRNSERETNEWASQLFGERSEIVVGASEAARLDGGWSRNQTSYNRSTQSRRVVSPDEFTTLAIPVAGDPERLFAESIVHLGSRATTQKLDLVWPVNPLRR